MYYFIKESIDRKDIQVIHVTGKRFYDEFVNKFKMIILNYLKNIRVYSYFYEIPEALNISSLVITSSGAITLAEISAVGVPSILIPKVIYGRKSSRIQCKSF